MSFTVQVVDLNCESDQQVQIQPKISMTTKSTTQIATVLGFPEFPGFASSPPKLYKTLTWEGTSEQQLWYPAHEVGNPGAEYQIAGARFDYSGSSTIDSKGNYLSTYTKNLSSMCQATGNLVTTLIGLPNGGFQNYVFVGWLGPNGHQKCAPPGIPYSFVGNEAIGKGAGAITDSSTFWGSKANGNIMVSDFNPVSSTFAACLDSGVDKNGNVFIALYEPMPQGVIPPITGPDQGTVWFFAGVVWDHNYSATLSDEYTDAEALANAVVITANGSVAKNVPRTTGFVSEFTGVNYTLTITNLIPNQAYLASVDFWDQTTGVVVTNQIGFTATSTTQTITGSIPTPAPGHPVQVRNPRISFSQ